MHDFFCWFFTHGCAHIKVIFHCKAFKLQGYNSVKFNLSMKPLNSQVQLKMIQTKYKFSTYIFSLCDLVILDGVGPVDNWPFTKNLFHSVQIKENRRKKGYKWWHVTCDTCYVKGGWRWTFSQNLAPLFLRFGNEGVLKIFSQRKTYLIIYYFN